MQYGDYQATLHYLRAVQKAGTDDARVVVKAMRDPALTAKIGPNVTIRADNQLTRPMFLVQIKPKAEVTFPGDYYRVLQVIPPEKVYSPLSESACRLVKK
jgi:branched-chain amino acid transport system substrate-binding protein